MSGATELARAIVARQRGISTISGAYGRVVSAAADASGNQTFIVELKSGEVVHCSISQTLQDRMDSAAGPPNGPVGREVAVLTDLVPPFVVDLVAGRGTIHGEFG